MNSAFFLSHGFRKDSELFLILQGGEDAPKTIRFYGPELRYLNPDERSTASLIRNALVKKFDREEMKSSPGVYVSRKGFSEIMEMLSETSQFIYLKEDGKEIREFEFPENPCYILGDDKDPTPEEEEIISKYPSEKICIGPQSLHADHCIIIAMNEFDRRQAIQ